MTLSTTTSTEERALELLSQNVPPTQVAAALGVTESRISQLLSDERFSEQLVTLKYNHLIEHSKRDAKADRIEGILLDRLLQTCEYLVDPLKIAAIYAKINAAKRRGTVTPESQTSRQAIVQLVMPVSVINNFTQNNIQVDTKNQVVRAGNQDLITVQSTRMDALLKQRKQSEQPALENGTSPTR